MSRKRLVVIIIAVLIISGGYYAWSEYNRGVKDLGSVDADMSADAALLIKDFTANEGTANKKYQDKIVAVKGMIKGIEKIDNTFTIVMGDTTDMSSVRCLVDSTHVEGVSKLKRGSIITIKGALTGFKKDETGLLGSDVELNRCVLQQ